VPVRGKSADRRRRPDAAARRRLVIADVALFYGERSGGIRTYVDERAAFAAASGAYEHHVIVPGRRERHHGGRHELRSLRFVPSTGYGIPLGAGALKQTLRAIRPDLVVLHDPFWRPGGVIAEARRLGARVVAVHHASAALNAAGIPGPDRLYLPLLRRVYHHAYAHVDAVMSVVDSRPDSGREATLPLRFGLHPAFRPGPAIRGDHVLYVGRLAWEKGVFCLLEAAAMAGEGWPLRLVGNGPARRAIESRAARLGVSERVEFRPFTSSRTELARLYREASCVVQPGPHETFGLVALEAAASGTRVVTCTTTPAARVAGPLAETFAPGEPAALLAAIDRARAVHPDVGAARALADGLRWERVFRAELDELTRALEIETEDDQPPGG
jgi:alpha-1,6-mannosyltransferase